MPRFDGLGGQPIKRVFPADVKLTPELKGHAPSNSPVDTRVKTGRVPNTLGKAIQKATPSTPKGITPAPGSPGGGPPHPPSFAANPNAPQNPKPKLTKGGPGIAALIVESVVEMVGDTKDFIDDPSLEGLVKIPVTSAAEIITEKAVEMLGISGSSSGSGSSDCPCPTMGSLDKNGNKCGRRAASVRGQTKGYDGGPCAKKKKKKTGQCPTINSLDKNGNRCGRRAASVRGKTRGYD